MNISKTAGNTTSNSAIYEGVVTHTRQTPVLHSFHYKVFMMFIDLTESEELLKK